MWWKAEQRSEASTTKRQIALRSRATATEFCLLCSGRINDLHVSSTTELMSEKALVERAIETSRDHQYALKVYAEHLEAELSAADKMIVSLSLTNRCFSAQSIIAKADIGLEQEDEDSLEIDGLVSVPGASRPASLLLLRVLLAEDSPFYEDAQSKKRYDCFTTVNPRQLYVLLCLRSTG